MPIELFPDSMWFEPGKREPLGHLESHQGVEVEGLELDGGHQPRQVPLAAFELHAALQGTTCG